ncbi:MAG: V-type ATP synthase subunit D [Methanocellales archaeon]|nr:V-type ATP synthase subunit D [Methanocellales archaeon]
MVKLAREIITSIRPTRMELLKLRKRRVLAEKGHDLLEEKRDALVMEFFKFIEMRRELKKELEEKIKRAYESLIEAQMIMGRSGVEGASYSVAEMADVAVDTKNIMGANIPIIEEMPLQEGRERGYGYAGTSVKLDEAASCFEEVLKHIFKLAENDGAIRMLAHEVEKTKRRVNALENVFIPQLSATQNYIEMHLEELEREDFFRRKRIKALLEEM